jgi:hydrogenase nickel incorporation protein HypA/HybF
MHELAICQDVLAQVRRIADERGATRVDRIVVVIGPLAGVEIPLLERAFSIARGGTLAANAELDAEISDIVVRCRTCGITSNASIGKLTCNSCGDWRVDVQQGEEMLLKTVELSGIVGGHLSAATTARSSEHV